MIKSYKTRGRGFTLVELLAVLVVLAILLVIAIPVIINVIDKVRKESYKRSIEAYTRAAENAIATWAVENPNKEYSTDEDIYKPYIETKGDKVECKKFEVEADTGKLTLRGCTTNKSRQKNSSISYKYEFGKVSEEIFEKYNIGDTFTFSGSLYHVISPSPTNQEYVVALKDAPLTVDEVRLLGFYHSCTFSGTKNWAGVFYDNTPPESSDYNQSDIKKIVDNWASTLLTGLTEDNEGYRARIISYDDLTTNLGYKKLVSGTIEKSTNGETPSWVYNSEYWYWTMSPVNFSISSVWRIGGDGRIYSHGNVNIYNGGVVRPVINVLKSEITKN